MSLIPNIWMSEVLYYKDVCKRNSLLVSASWPFMFEIYINKSLRSYIYLFSQAGQNRFFFQKSINRFKMFLGQFQVTLFWMCFFYETFKANFKLCIWFLSNLCKNDFNTVLDRSLFSIANDFFVNLSDLCKMFVKKQMKYFDVPLTIHGKFRFYKKY